MKKQKIVVLATLLLTLLAWPLVLWLPLDMSNPDTHGHVATLIVTAMLTIVNGGAAALFIMGRQKFTSELKAAYVVIGVGLVAYAVSNMQYPLLLVLGLRGSFFMEGGPTAILPVVGIVTMYAGIRRFARQFEIHAFTLKWRLVLAGSAAAAVLAAILPIPAVQDPALAIQARATLAFVAWASIFILANTYVMYRIKVVAGRLYTPALTWFFVGLAFQALMAPQAIIAVYLLGPDHPYSNSPYLYLPVLLSGLALLRSAYLFNAIGSLEADSRKKPAKPMTKAISSIDVVICAAQLASNTESIDPLLDRVRIMTAMVSGDHTLTDSQEAELLSIYKALENYLVHKEPVLQFTPDEVRQQVVERLGILEENNGTILDRLST